MNTTFLQQTTEEEAIPLWYVVAKLPNTPITHTPNIVAGAHSKAFRTIWGAIGVATALSAQLAEEGRDEIGSVNTVPTGWVCWVAPASLPEREATSGEFDWALVRAK